MLANARRLAPAFALTLVIALTTAGCHKSGSDGGSAAATDMIHAPEMTLGIQRQGNGGRIRVGHL